MHIFDTPSQHILAALKRSQAIIEFTPSGEILDANANFLKAMGYELGEIRGRHHRLFCDPHYVSSEEYKKFWSNLSSGRYQSAEFKRMTKDGQAIWLQATYNPILDRRGRVTKVVKIATDITDLKRKSLDDAGKIAAIYKSQAVIEFTPEGTIITANDNFLGSMGYELRELEGKSHRMLCEHTYVSSEGYQKLWQHLRDGHFESGEFERLAKDGHRVYIRAAYNPIFDEDGRVVKIVKFAVDMTAEVEQRLANSAISREIDGQLLGVIEKVGSARNMAEAAGQTSDTTAGIVSSVAAASEELNASVQGIAFGMAQARESVHTIYETATGANQSAQGLNQSADSMGQVIALIQNIASQINLLALNATGDAGKGFAVVASEVKALAKQAAQSTATISHEINKMQAVSNDVVAAINAISAALDEVLRNVTEAAQAIDQQSTVTGEISHSMQSAVRAVHDIKATLAHVSGTFSTVETDSTAVKTNVERLVA
jgi:methyl-accepting chemotaxis protein